MMKTYVPLLCKENHLAHSTPVKERRLETRFLIQYKLVSGVTNFHKSALELPMVVSKTTKPLLMT